MHDNPIKRLIEPMEFKSDEEREQMLQCAEVFDKGGVSFLGKHSYQLADVTEIPAYYWSMFLSLAPIKMYIKNTVAQITKQSANSAILGLNNSEVSSPEVARAKLLQELAIEAGKDDNRQVYIMTHVPPKAMTKINKEKEEKDGLSDFK